MILDLSEQGMSMQTAAPLDVQHPIQLHLNLPEPVGNLETTGYIAWADALGRAGVRFSELPEESRLRLQQWLTLNDNAHSRKAPTLSLGEPAAATHGTNVGSSENSESLAMSQEPLASVTEKLNQPSKSTNVQFEY